MKTVYENPWFRVVKDEQYHYVQEDASKNGAVVLLKIADDWIFIESYRKAHDAKLIEAPRGYGDKGESAEECALREVFEETGYQFQISDVVKLGVVRPNSAILASAVSAFLVEVTEAHQLKEPDDEVMSIVRIPESELPSIVASGDISDGFTLSALSLYWAKKLV